MLLLHPLPTCTNGIFLQPLAQTLLVLVVVSLVATCTGGFFLPPTGTHTQLALKQLCTVWWWSVVVVVVCDVEVVVVAMGWWWYI